MTTIAPVAAPLTSAPAAIAFALAGKARLTLRSKKTGVRFTYRVLVKEGKPAFVSVLTGANNEEDYTFLGTLFEGRRYRHGAKSPIGVEAPSAKAFEWAWEKLRSGVIPANLEVWHEGRCCRCARLLTDPESIEDGVGPECRKRMAA